MAGDSKSALRDFKYQGPIPERYTDEVGAGSSSSAIPLLAHSDYSQDAPDPDEELPGYSDNTSGEISRDGAGANDGAGAPPPFAPYRPVVKKIKTVTGDTLTVSHDQHLNTDGEALYRWLKEESLIPPKPQVRIKGTHQVRRRKGDKTETSTVIDFDMTLGLEAYFLEGNSPNFAPRLKTVDPDTKTNRGGRWKTIATDLEVEEARTVRRWADQYCEDKSTLKEFIMKKSCVGWDLKHLQTQIDAMLRSINYIGHIDISFPVYETRVEVFPSNRISRMRKNGWWKLLFYVTFFWIFLWPYLWFFTKRYHVAETIWHYSDWVTPEGQQARRVYINEEEEWLMTWGAAIKRAARARRMGVVTGHDIGEMISHERLGAVRAPQTGNSTVDSALGFIAGVGSIANDMRLSRGEIVGWGGDEGW